MVSTRLMSSVGGGEVAGSSGVEAAAVSRVTRHSSGLLPGGSSPPTHTAALQPPPAASPQPSINTQLAIYRKPIGFTTNLLDLPIEVLEKIFSFLGFKTVSHMRMVNRQFNLICCSILNSTFQRLQNQMLQRFQAIKAKMPRRESARRSHPLACESDIIETLHMRLSLLQMTFGKHIERKHCCFFPGEILDEVYAILAYLKTAAKLARPYKVTDELFDLTTMAMEYFKEHIEPNLPEITYFGTDFFDITTAFSPGESSKSYICMDSPPPSGFEAITAGGSVSGGSGGGERRVSSVSFMLEESLPPSPPPPQSNMVLRKRIHRIKQGMKKYNDQLSALRSDLRSCKRKTALQQKQIGEQQKQIAEQQKQTLEYANRLDDYDKKNEETSRKFQTLLQELNKCKTELQYWRSRSPAVPPLCAECGASLPQARLQWLAAANAESPEVETAGGSGEGAPRTELADPPAAPAPPPPPPARSDEAAASPPAPAAARRPAPVDADPAEPAAAAAQTPERKKRRLTRPRKL